MKKIFILVVFYLLFSIFFICDKTGKLYEGQFFYYRVFRGGISIQSLTGKGQKEQSLTIPNSIDNLPVLTCGYYDFFNKSFGGFESTILEEVYFLSDDLNFQVLDSFFEACPNLKKMYLYKPYTHIINKKIDNVVISLYSYH